MTFWQCATGSCLIGIAFLLIVAACMMASQLSEIEANDPERLRIANRIDAQRKV